MHRLRIPVGFKERLHLGLPFSQGVGDREVSGEHIPESAAQDFLHAVGRKHQSVRGSRTGACAGEGKSGFRQFQPGVEL